MTDMSAYERQSERVIALLESLEVRSPTAPGGIDADARDRAIAIVRESAHRLRGGDARPGAASAISLTRLIVDGSGPREPDNPLLTALAELDRARAESAGADLPLLPRVAVRELLEARRPVTRADMQRIAGYGVLIPALPADGGVRVVQLLAPDGRVVIPAFCDRSLFDEWAASAGAHSTSASLVRIGDVTAVLADRDGLALNPLNENIFVSTAALLESIPPDGPRGRVVLDAGAPISFGRAAHPGLDPRAVTDAAAAIRSVAAVYALSVVQNDQALTVWVVDTGGDQDGFDAFGSLLSQRVGPGGANLLSADTPLGRTMAQSTPPIYRRA